MTKPPIERFETPNGVHIFRLPLEVFNGYIGMAHLLLYEGKSTLIDVGSGYSNSPADLEQGFAALRNEYRLDVSLSGLDRIIITHGHVDHFGGLRQVQDIAANAIIACHELTRPVLLKHDERVLLAKAGMDAFLQRAGVPDERRNALMNMFMLGKQAFPVMRVDETLHDGDLIDELIQVIHVPGHAPGQVMLLIDDVLLTADHVLPQTSVALAPETIMPYTGVGHYIEALQRAQSVTGVRMALGGHEEPMEDYPSVVQGTLDSAMKKVERVLEHCDEPRSIYDIACRIYDSMAGYSELLKIEQTGARVEYLTQRGYLLIENLNELETQSNPKLTYQRV
ncbi:MAG: MBL fold metallo-hydrolase [Chloroflexi bacterium]|nr:MBL fold metallo-hydrolase [Chloroflexota bacterium]